MNAILARSAAAPTTRAPAPVPAPTLRQLLTALLHATLDRLSLPQRDVPPEFFRFPML